MLHTAQRQLVRSHEARIREDARHRQPPRGKGHWTLKFPSPVNRQKKKKRKPEWYQVQLLHTVLPIHTQVVLQRVALLPRGG